ncbi:conserved hypothetical protein [Agrobacterium tomkonis CFBP 6623]|uniref:Uncharacterized protein n=1 Tax=Agrobacterium tomkonis CFBP 6623 TaxID=1183432 RepID=A0A1S7RXS0_9HYPH|nr:conserved hypothetical protein [Agrobacterium tomkonis CFBP 6623]
MAESISKKGGHEAPFQLCDAPFVVSGSAMRHTHATRGLFPAYVLRTSFSSKIPVDFRSGLLVPALLAAVILVVDDVDRGLVAIQDTAQDTGLVAVQNPVIGQDTVEPQIDAWRHDDKRATLVAVSGKDTAQKTASIGLTNGSDSKNSGYASKFSNHFSLLLCLITPSGVTGLYI